MHIETKYLRLHTPVTLNSWFGDWQVCWLGAATRSAALSILTSASIRSGRYSTRPAGFFRSSALPVDPELGQKWVTFLCPFLHESLCYPK